MATTSLGRVNNIQAISGEDVNYVAMETNFWDVKAYRHTVHRLENAHLQCIQLCSLLQERAEIEKVYSASLRKWSSKWNSHINTNPEYGGCKAVWRAVCTEANELAAVHEEIREGLRNVVPTEIRRWQKEHFHKTILPPQQLRQVQELEQAFHAAQQPWAKCQKAVQISHKAYLDACQALQNVEAQLATCENQIHSANIRRTADAGDANSGQTETSAVSGLSSCPFKKAKIELEAKVNKAKDAQARAKVSYELALQRIHVDESRYKGEMSRVFDGAQGKEKERIQFIQQMFQKIHTILCLTHGQKVSQIYTNFYASVAHMNAEYDLAWWAAHYGKDMALIPPQFMEFNPDARSSSGQRPFTFRSSKAVTGLPMKTVQRPSIVVVTNGALTLPITVATNTEDSQRNSLPISADSSNPFDEPEPENYGAMMNGNECGQSSHGFSRAGQELTTKGNVRAVYSFKATEVDELSLKEGEVVEKLDDEDEQGWCTGRKGGRVGYFPGSYVVPVA